jgi:thioesterase-3
MNPTLRLKVRGYHCDFYGHVNNARYLEFLEEARWALFEAQLDLDTWKASDVGLVVAAININYRRPALLNAELEIRSGLHSLGQRSGVIRQEVFDCADDTLIADADVTFVLIDLASGQPREIAGDWRRALRRALPPF